MVPVADDRRQNASLVGALAGALEQCRVALADYEAGLTSDSDLCDRLVDVGVVRHGHDVYLLDLEAGAWLRYDGVTVRGPDLLVRRADLSRWRRVLVDLGGRSEAAR